MATNSYRRLQQYAVAISIVSIIYCAAEGAVSIGFGAESASLSLVFFGIQSGIEVTSACMVLWRFRKVAAPGEERSAQLNPRDLRFEKIATGAISGLIILLALATEGTAIAGLVTRREPDDSNASLIISASALVLMVLLWLPKRYLARALDSSAMQGETQCSLSCIQITIVLFIGALVFRLWKGGWWVDSATSLILGLLFAWEAYKMGRWVLDPNFNGGCCGHDHTHEEAKGWKKWLGFSRKKVDDIEHGSEVSSTLPEDSIDTPSCETCAEKHASGTQVECVALPRQQASEKPTKCCTPAA